MDGMWAGMTALSFGDKQSLELVSITSNNIMSAAVEISKSFP